MTLGDLIELFLTGYDDKVYFNIYEGGFFMGEELFERIRIIDSELKPYLDRKVTALADNRVDPLMVNLE